MRLFTWSHQCRSRTNPPSSSHYAVILAVHFINLSPHQESHQSRFSSETRSRRLDKRFKLVVVRFLFSMLAPVVELALVVIFIFFLQRFRPREMAISPCATECKHHAPVTAHLLAIFSRTIVLRAMFTTLLTPTRRSPLPQQPTPVPPSTATAVRQPLHFTGHLLLEAHFAQWGREYGRNSVQPLPFV